MDNKYKERCDICEKTILDIGSATRVHRLNFCKTCVSNNGGHLEKIISKDKQIRDLTIDLVEKIKSEIKQWKKELNHGYVPVLHEGEQMKILIFGSTELISGKSGGNILKHFERTPHMVRFMYVDSEIKDTGLKKGIEANKAMVEWCDEGILFYNGRSQGTLIDIGMFIMANKPYKIGYLEEKITLTNLIKEFSSETK